MSKLHFGKKMARVTLDSAIKEKVERTLRRALPKTMDVMERTVEKLSDDARDVWPFKTGRSKGAFEHGVRLVSLDRIEAFVRNNATDKTGFPYPYTIRSLKVDAPGRGTTWTKLVRRPARKVGKKLGEELVEELAEDFNGS